MAEKKTSIPAGAKKPEDHKKSADNKDHFEFTHEGKTHTSRPLRDVLSPGFIRQNRRREDMDFYFTLLEELFDGDAVALAALDAMSWREFNAVSEQLEALMRDGLGAALGE